jgi:hypothetical protein
MDVCRRRQQTAAIDLDRGRTVDVVGWGSPLPAFRPASLPPELARDRDGIDAGLLPPGGLVAHAVHQPMMDATQWDREFVVGLAAQGSRLHEPKVMRIGRFAPAEQAGLSGHIAKVRLIAIAAGYGKREHAFVEALGRTLPLGSDRFWLVCGRHADRCPAIGRVGPSCGSSIPTMTRSCFNGRARCS